MLTAMFSAIYIPDFPVAAIVRAEAMLRESAVAVLEGKPPLTRVVARNEKARLLGMEAGMTKLQAVAFAEPASGAKRMHPPQLALLRERSHVQEDCAHAALLDVAHAFTPRVEDAAPDTLLLDLAGLERLYGAPSRMASLLSSRVAAIGLDANIAVAATPDAAMHAARGFTGNTVIAAGKEAQRLGVLPITILLDAFDISAQQKNGDKAAVREREKLRAQILDTLERWGVRDFRTLGLLPEHALSSRLGEVGVKLRRLALGATMRTLALCEPATRFEEAVELESPVETIESLSFVLNRLLEQLCARLEARALAAQELRICLQLERRVAAEETTTLNELAAPDSHNVAYGSVIERTLRLPVPMRDAKVFLKLLQLDLTADPPGAPVVKLWITAEPAAPRSAQRGLFLPITPEPEKLEITLSRVKAIVGERRAGIARLLDSHRPGSFRLDRFVAPQESPSTTMSDTPDATPLALRVLRPPCRLNVQLAEGRPAKLAANSKQRPELDGNIVWSAGPWRSSGDWWTDVSKEEGPWDREEWDVALTCAGNSSNVALYRIYRDVGTGDWFADASYD